ncbi:hypothetical protein [Candidatus Epulonipiscium viviparus]|uniref:hypothetical protein n=1 Tax=Candidatus Epulonipiscium viviparus TaxID=420336 RepID=UPI00273813F0|nr:hypothetical protein [Candidatus Epulopiscium viviparus]
MKKFIKFVAAAMVFASFGAVMAAAPTTATFTKVSFEPGETTTWVVDADNGASHATVAEGVADGASAMKVSIPNRASDWAATTHFALTPPKGKLWSINKSDYLTATVTNPNAFEIQLRVNITDSANNERVNYFIIPSHQTREISVSGAQYGAAGVEDEFWGEDGYKQKGVNVNAIKEISFYLPEPDAKQMAGQTSLSYIIDNIEIQTPAEYAVVDGACVLATVIPSAKPTSSGTIKLLHDTFTTLNDKLVSKNKPLQAMSVQVKSAAGPLFSDANRAVKAVKPGDKVTLALQMYDSYSIAGGAGTSTLEVGLSSPKNIEILTPTLSWTFTDDKTIGKKGQSLNFEFIMPNGTVDALADFDWTFNLK